MMNSLPRPSPVKNQNSEEIYSRIGVERPLPSLPDEVDYGDNNYILTIASVPQKSPTGEKILPILFT